MADRDELLQLTQELLDSIAVGDWDTYTRLCDPSLTAFEPEARGHLVEGMPFHQFYFELEQARSAPAPKNTTIAAPHVRVLGDSAVVAYTRLVQQLDENHQPQTAAFEETRIWTRQDGQWRHVHFHRSPA